MASVIMMEQPSTGIIKKGFYGFSWTTLFFGGFPAFFRGDLVEGILIIIASCLTGGLAQIIWAFVYNKRYTLKLVSQGFKFAGDPSAIALAKAKLGIAAANTSATLQNQ